jgi:formylglycine-generating enzyme required for sulfatase activity
MFREIHGMSTQQESVRLIRIFVSSPGDVAQERETLDEVIGAINDVQGRQSGVRLEAWKWEDQVVPQIGPPPQTVVDSQLPTYDIYLGIMASRFGTPTEQYGSGTEKEFRDALARWGDKGTPWILFYFHNNPPPPKNSEEALQYSKVWGFREELETKGIVRSYTGVRGEKSGFYEQVSKHLQQLAFQLTAQQPTAQPQQAKSTKPSLPPGYCTWLQKQCADIDLLGLRLKQGQAVRLNHVYVPLTTTYGKGKPIEQESPKEAAWRHEEEPPPLLLELLNEQSLYVSGAPGSGKSTFSRWVSWLACADGMPEQAIEVPEGYREVFPVALQNRLPLWIRLRDFWECLPTTPDAQDLSQAELESVLATWLEKKQPGKLEWPHVQAYLQAGRLLLILDGVDEVPLTQGQEGQVRYPRAMLLSGLAAARPAWLERGNRLLVTSRPYGLNEADIHRLGLTHAPISDLTEPLQSLLVARWFHILADDLASGAVTAAEMRAELDTREELAPLVANPMLLTAICIIYSQGKSLPQDKYELYDRIVDNVMYNRYKEKAGIDLERSRLSVIAHGMHTGDSLGEQRSTPQAEITLAEIDTILKNYQEKSAWTEQGYKGVIETRERLLSRSGLLLPQGQQRAGFYHFTFQDFLAGQWLQDVEGERLLGLFRERAETTEWHNTLSFVFSALLARSTTPDRSIKLLSLLVDAIDETTLGLSLVVADCLNILMGRKYRLAQQVEAKFREICLSAIAREVPVQARCRLGLALGRVGDTRLVNDLRDRSGFVEVPAGDYRIGEERRRFELKKPIGLSRYPVTNAQYALFIEEDGYRNAKWWSETGWQWRGQAGIEEPHYWRHAKWNGANQPVVGVSFWEALAFAAWAGGRLPTEWEWEAAARGPEGFEYPWGNEWEDGICNTIESGLGQTTPVGLFPRSLSPHGLEDMAGNVWEWCLSTYNNPDDISIGGDGARVCRGGSWVSLQYGARASYRDDFPHSRINVLGFRLCCEAPIH